MRFLTFWQQIFLNFEARSYKLREEVKLGIGCSNRSSAIGSLAILQILVGTLLIALVFTEDVIISIAERKEATAHFRHYPRIELLQIGIPAESLALFKVDGVMESPVLPTAHWPK